jgi:uncharacterized membrane protein YfcA
MVAIIALALVSGALIGCIGIDGVLLVACLRLAGIDVHEAIGASMFSFIFAGTIAARTARETGSGRYQKSSTGIKCPRDCAFGSASI